MRINALEDQETGFQCGDADDNDEGRYILLYSFFAIISIPLMKKKKKKFIGGFIYEKKQSGLCMGT